MTFGFMALMDPLHPALLSPAYWHRVPARARDRPLNRTPDTLGGALVILALLGGYLHRPNAPPPGPTYMGRGPAPLTAQADVDERRSRMGILERRRPEPRHQKLRPDKTCD